MVVGCLLLLARCLLFLADCILFVVCCLRCDVRRSSCVVCCLLFVVRHVLFVCCWLTRVFGVCGSSFVVRCSSFVVFLFAVCCMLLCELHVV